MVIRNSMGVSLSSYSDSIVVSDNNVAEVYTIPVGSHELRRIGGFSVIIERDSFFAIQWGLGNATYPWRLTNWVKEIRKIANQSKCKV